MFFSMRDSELFMRRHRNVPKSSSEEDILKFMQQVSKNFKGDRIAFENQVRALYDRVDAIKYEGVWASTFVPGDNVIEITFRWQRRWRVYATGAEETATQSPAATWSHRS